MEVLYILIMEKESVKERNEEESNPRGDACPLVQSQEWLMEMCLEEMGRV